MILFYFIQQNKYMQYSDDDVTYNEVASDNTKAIGILLSISIVVIVLTR